MGSAAMDPRGSFSSSFRHIGGGIAPSGHLQPPLVGARTHPSVLAAVRSAGAVALRIDPRYRLEVLADAASLDARLRRSGDAAPAAMVVELHPRGPGAVAPLVRTLTRHFPGVPLIVACTERTPDGREVLGAAHAGAELFAFPPDDDLSAIVARLVGNRPRESEASIVHLPRLARRILALLSSTDSAPDSIAALVEQLSMSARTLQRRMSLYGWPAPANLLIWGRLLRGAHGADLALRRNIELTSAMLAESAGFQSVRGAATAYRRLADVALSTVLSQGSSSLTLALASAFPTPSS